MRWVGDVVWDLSMMSPWLGGHVCGLGDVDYGGEVYGYGKFLVCWDRFGIGFCVCP